MYAARAVLVTALAATGCSDDYHGGQLVRVDAEAAGENCACGGVAVHTGFDENSDGELDDNEIKQTDYVCDGQDGEDGTSGQDGAVSLIETSPEGGGENCAGGGTRVDSGTDTDADGELDSDEVTATSYLCNGQPGRTRS